MLILAMDCLIYMKRLLPCGVAVVAGASENKFISIRCSGIMDEYNWHRKV